MGFELALPVVFFSGVQHYGLVPENLNQVPSEVIDYLKAVPTVWDDTRMLVGYPGKECVIARRSGKTWYIAGINGENYDKTLNIDTDAFLKGSQKGLLIADEPAAVNKVVCSEFVFPAKGSVLEMKVRGNGGFVLIFKEK